MHQEDKITFDSQYWRFLWSSILIALSGCLGNIVDAIIVGNLISADAVSAINLSRTVIQFMFTLSMLLSTGAGMLVGIQLGKNDTPRATYIYTVSMALSLAVGIILTLCGLTVPHQLAGWLCNNQQLYQPTYDYLVPMLLGAPAYMIMWALSTMVGVDGSPRLVSFAILVDNAVNLICDIIFIQWLGWGVAGSSIATVLGHIVGILIMCRHYLYQDNHLHLTWHHPQPALADIISQGTPLAVASICLTLLMYSANTIVLTSLGRIGIFALSVCMNLLQIYNLFLAGVCRTIQSLGAIQVGKGDNVLFRQVIHKSFRFITIAMLLTCLYVWIDPASISRLFGADTADIIAESNYALRIFALSFIPFCYIYTIMIVYKLYGYHKIALFISFALSLTVIPVLWLISRYYISLIWYSYLIAYAIEIILIVAIHYIGNVRFQLDSDTSKL